MKPTALTVDDYQDMVQLFHEETDRGAAVLAGSYIESYLGTFLESKMVDQEERLKERIFGSNGPLSSFSQRIDFAQAFGLLGAQACAQLHLIRKIRNHFAHHPKDASFSKSPVIDWVGTIADRMPLSGDQQLFGKNDGRIVYLITVGMLFIVMQSSNGAAQISDQRRCS